MTLVRLTHVWSDGSETSVHIKVEANYPDAIDEARVQAVRALREAMAALSEE